MCNVFAGIPRESYESQTRSVRLNGHSTSIRLEAVYWDILERLADKEGLSLSRFLTELHDEVLDLHGEARNFSSLLRCVCLVHLSRTSTTPLRVLETERT
ncbi:aryl-sulfate sulfotransferase [Acuticoccus sediminis]|uniref:Aryl-sulfate sulfotransferase n=1 Tax=Acuticoccus sediminis TaxID=2184697 RepID=A0A8B2P6S9_9HYPH|nr:ribbon-helix-helix domain-containing protein [Acuticoccus sediminis]RAI04289.1 aryl-sulfate sulfotransferase [Acuticoccus sediminis]